VLSATDMASDHGQSHGASICALPIMWNRYWFASDGQEPPDCALALAAKKQPAQTKTATRQRRLAADLKGMLLSKGEG